MFRLTSLCLMALLSAAFAAPALAQPAQTGTIAGVVEDASGAVLPGVTVTITSQAGFAPLRQTDNLVETEKTTTVPFSLKVGGLTDSVTVTGETPIVDLTNVTSNLRVRREEFERLMSEKEPAPSTVG